MVSQSSNVAPPARETLLRSSHIAETFTLAWPLILTQVGQIVVGMVDNVFLGRLGVAELGAGILSNNVFVLVLVFAMGMSLGSTPLVSAAYTGGERVRLVSLFKNSLFLNAMVALVCFTVLFNLSGYLSVMRQPPSITELAVPFFDVLVFSILPLSLFFTCKQYCEGLGNTRVALMISAAGNLLNILLNYLLIYGKWGLPQMGYMGSAWASFWARMFMGIAFVAFVFGSDLTREVKLYFNAVKVGFAELKQLWHLGVNSGLQFTFEVATFVCAGLMAGMLGEVQLDAHGVALSIAGFTYMFGNGISGAATIRVSAAAAGKSFIEVKNAIRAALVLVLIIMGAFGVLLMVGSDFLPALFSNHPHIVGLASRLLMIAALFQLFDGLQVVAIGLLRGLGDVRVSTLITFAGYWLFALPMAWLLAFKFALGTEGIWFGLLAALAFVSCGLLLRLRWLLRSRA